MAKWNVSVSKDESERVEADDHREGPDGGRVFFNWKDEELDEFDVVKSFPRHGWVEVTRV